MDDGLIADIAFWGNAAVFVDLGTYQKGGRPIILWDSGSSGCR